MDWFVFNYVSFSIISDYNGVIVVWMVLEQLRENLSWPKVRVLMIMQGLVSFNIKHVISAYLIEKWIFESYDYAVKLGTMVLNDDKRTKESLHNFREWF